MLTTKETPAHSKSGQNQGFKTWWQKNWIRNMAISLWMYALRRAARQRPSQSV